MGRNNLANVLIKSRFIVWLILLLVAIPRVHAIDMTVSSANPYANNDGLCSLVEAIDNANADTQIHADCPAGSGADTITLATTINVDGSTLFPAPGNLGNAGLPEITSDITIRSGGIQRTGATQLRFFSITFGGSLTLEEMTIQGGIAAGDCTTTTTGSNSGCGGAIVVDEGSVALSGVTLSNNQAIASTAGDNPRGGAIALIGGALTITESVFDNNQAGYGGGAIYGQYNSTDSSITDSTFSNNTASTIGGAIVNLTTADLVIFGSTFTSNQVTAATGSINGGGAIYNAQSALLTVVNSNFSGNSAENGGAINNHNAGISYISNSTFTGNSATSGGAIVNQGSGATLNLYSSVVTGNTAGDGAGISNGNSEAGVANIFNSTVSGNNATSDGGGIWNLGTLTIENSNITGNTGTDGAGIFVATTPPEVISIFGTNVSNNVASGTGGGIYVTQSFNGSGTTLTIDTSTFDNNTADDAGGLFAEVTTTTISNSTFSNNNAISGSGGGIFLQDFVGPPVLNNSITNSTISANTATGNGGGIYANVNPLAASVSISSSTITGNSSSSTNTNVGDGVHDSLGAVSVQDTIIANNGDRDCTAIGVTDNGNNIGSDGTCTFTTDNTNPNLGALSDNGGFTQTHALLAGSPAINNGSGACPSTDQRGSGRVDGNCDIGAYEATTQPLAEITLSVNQTTLYEDGTITVATITVVIDNTASTADTRIIIPLTVTGTASGVSTDYSLSNQNGVGSGSAGFVNNIDTTVAGGATFTDTFTVTVIDDAFIEANEIATITAGIVGYGSIISSNTLSITIISDDLDPVIPVTSNATATDSNIQIIDPAISKIGFLQTGQLGLQGEIIEWFVTVSNPGPVTASNLIVTDTLRDELQLISATLPDGLSSSTNGQTVTVTIPVLNPGQSVQFSILTRIISGGQTIENTACVTPATQETCATAPVVTSLPDTGETPAISRLWWVLLCLCGGLFMALAIQSQRP